MLHRPSNRHLSIVRVALIGTLAICSLDRIANAQETPPTTTASPKDLVDALHTAFGEHHARAVHTKGVMLEGTFTPADDAKTVTKESIFSGSTVPVVSRFSVFAGVPAVPDTDDGAAPAGFAVKIKAADGDDFDIETNQHKDFITATSEEFRTFLQAVGAAGKGDKAPLTAFLDSHPHAKEFLGSLTYPTSYAKAVYFGVNSVKLTNEQGQSVFARYRLIPKAGEQYLSPEERKTQGPNYLQEEIVKRVGSEPIVFDWYAQIAEAGDKIEDPSIAWPETRKLVKLGTFTLTKQPADPDAAQHALLFLPGQPHPGVEAADPMLTLRNKAYPISFKERQ